jgi:hypothetical protein
VSARRRLHDSQHLCRRVTPRRPDELRQPFGVDEPPPADKLQAVACAPVTKAVAHDVLAIKEILECINGNTPAVPTTNDLQQLVNLSWKQLKRPSKMPSSKMRRSKKSKSSPSTDEPSMPPSNG